MNATNDFQIDQEGSLEALAKHIERRLKERAFCVVFENEIERATTYLPRVATVLFAISIFIADTGTLVETAFAVLYVVVVLMATRFLPVRGVWLVASGCAGLSVLSFFLTPPPTPVASSNSRSIPSMKFSVD